MIRKLFRKRRTALAAGLAVLALAALLYAKAEVTMAGNDATRFALIQALAEQGTFAIERTDFRTVDHVIRNGHAYSDKPPVPALLAAAVWTLPHRLLGLNFHDHYGLGVYLLNLLLAGGANLGLFALFFQLLRRTTRLANPQILLWSLALTLGTWLFSYSVLFNNHTWAALALLGWFACLKRYDHDGARRASFGAGLLAGLTFAFEYPAGAIFTLAGLAAIGRAGLVPYLAGAALPAALAALVNYLGYDTVLPLYLGSQGTFHPGFGGKSYLRYFFDLLFGTRGVFVYQPVLLLLFPALYGWQRRRPRPPAELAALAGTLALVLFYGIFTNEYGGWNYGCRYLIPAIPLWFYFVARCFGERARFRRWGAAVVTLWLIGLVTAWVGAYNPFCCAYEGPNSPPGSPTYAVQSTFAGNLLCLTYAADPDGWLARKLIDHYSPELAYRFLEASYVNTKEIDQLRQLVERVNAEPR